MGLRFPKVHRRSEDMTGIDTDRSRFWRSTRPYWLQMLAEGIILIILGWLAFSLPYFAPATVLNAILGWLFVVSGLVGLVTTAGGRHGPGFWWSLLSAVLAIAVGSTLMEWPTANSIPITYLLTIFFVIEGIATIMYALSHRRQLSGRWEWMFASGCVDLALAALVVLGLPATVPFTVGILVGINMVFGGSALLAMAIYAHTTRFPKF
jgi:uncharacterized membrane protein HdeD (DUF308 family)